MKYKVGEIIITCLTNEVKTIVDSEIISDVEIYYMDDSTSYSSIQIFSAKEFLGDNLTIFEKSIVMEMEQDFYDSLDSI
jgi:hypothetical protein